MFIHINKVKKQKITNTFASITLPFVFSTTTLFSKLSGSTADTCIFYVPHFWRIFHNRFSVVFDILFCLFYCVIMEETLSFIISFHTFKIDTKRIITTLLIKRKKTVQRKHTHTHTKVSVTRKIFIRDHRLNCRIETKVDGYIMPRVFQVISLDSDTENITRWYWS